MRPVKIQMLSADGIALPVDVAEDMQVRVGDDLWIVNSTNVLVLQKEPIPVSQPKRRGRPPTQTQPSQHDSPIPLTS